MPHRRQFFVEVSTETPETTVVNRIPAKDWAECVQVARELTTNMFYDDPMAERVFHNGLYKFEGENDLGHMVKIIPTCLMGEEKFVDLAC